MAEVQTGVVTRQGLAGGRVWWAVGLLLLLVYIPTATYSLRQSIDTFNTSVQAYQIAIEGTPALDGLNDPQGLAVQHRPGRHGTVTDRHPGSVAVGVVAYTVARPLLADPQSVTSFVEVPLWPTAVASSILAMMAAVLIGMAISRLPGATEREALAVAIVLGLGTGTWSVTANALWTHTVTQVGLAMAVFSLARGGSVAAGTGFGLAVLARPHTAAIALFAGLSAGSERRRVSTVAVIGLFSVMGLVAAVAYGLWVFGGDPSLTVGRGEVVDRLQYEGARTPWFGALGNILLLFVHPIRGLFPMTPFLIPLVPMVPRAWKQAPLWVRGLAVGGLAQLLVQGAINHYSGGASFFGSRLTLEFLTATAPLWYLAYRAARDRPRLQYWVHVTAGASIVVHAVGATVLRVGWA